MATFDDLVQICLPTRNGEAHLARALDSLLAQTHRNIVLTIVDNASTDRTAEIARAYEQRDSRVRYLRHSEFVCATDNWNRAFATIDPERSEFFMWANDDDICADNYIAELLHLLKTDSSLVLAYSQFNVIDENDNVISRNGYRRIYPSGKEFARTRSIIINGKYCAIYGIMRLNAVTWRPVLTDLSFGSDLWFMLQLCAAGPFGIVNEPLFFKRVGGISETHEDLSASNDPDVVWNIGEKEWAAISALPCRFVTKLYAYNRLKVSAKLFHPGKRINPLLLPWVWLIALRANPRWFGLRSRLGRWVEKGVLRS